MFTNTLVFFNNPTMESLKENVLQILDMLQVERRNNPNGINTSNSKIVKPEIGIKGNTDIKNILESSYNTIEGLDKVDVDTLLDATKKVSLLINDLQYKLSNSDDPEDHNILLSDEVRMLIEKRSEMIGDIPDQTSIIRHGEEEIEMQVDNNNEDDAEEVKEVEEVASTTKTDAIVVDENEKEGEEEVKEVVETVKVEEDEKNSKEDIVVKTENVSNLGRGRGRGRPQGSFKLKLGSANGSTEPIEVDDPIVKTEKESKPPISISLSLSPPPETLSETPSPSKKLPDPPIPSISKHASKHASKKASKQPAKSTSKTISKSTPKAVSKSPSKVSNAESNDKVSSNNDKSLTAAAKYGYPNPPPLSSYNGKIGRSFYSSPLNPSTPILPNSQVAYCPGKHSDSGRYNGEQSEWILCRVLKILSETRFEIQDPEPDDLHPHGQIFRANYKEVILVPLHLVNGSSKLKEYKSGSKVLAKYPETTTFYPAEVLESRNSRCMLRFDGEEEVGKLTPVDRVFVLPWPK